MLSLKPNDVQFIGRGLVRPECVLATRGGDLFASDGRGGVSVIRADGTQGLILPDDAPDDFLPNGIALMPNRDVLIANLGAAGGVWRLRPDGALSLEISEVDGLMLPPINFVGLDGDGRLWITVSTRVIPRQDAFHKGHADGLIVVHDSAGTRIVAEGLGFTNEAIVDPSGDWLYVNETIAQRTSRFRIRPDASLGPRETVAEYGPATFPDGFAHDSEGGVWIVSVGSNRVIRVSRSGETHLVLEDCEPAAMDELQAAFDQGRFDRDMIDIANQRPLANLSSIAFGGPDLKTVYMGSLGGDRIATFRSPIAGAAPVHWNF
jgi:sugar lactone lactonase YvrE